VAKFQGTAGILMHEDALNGDDIRTIFVNDAADGLENVPQAIRKGSVDAFHSPARNVQRFVTVEIDDAETGQARARVDSEYAFSCRQISLRFVQVRLH
jgi:hypothetical protein